MTQTYKTVSVDRLVLQELRKLPGVGERDSNSLLARAAMHVVLHDISFEEALRVVFRPAGRKKRERSG